MTCRVRGVIKDSPADHAGLHVGDVLLRLDNAEGRNVPEQIANSTPGRRTTIHFQRGTESKEVPITIEDQVALNLRAAELGDASAETLSAKFTAMAKGVPKNLAEVLKWFRKGAEQGDPRSQWNLGSLYAYGFAIGTDSKTATDWYRKAADQGLPKAEAHLGSMYFDGNGVPKDSYFDKLPRRTRRMRSSALE
jgi:PDZ domain/Sel1 repeat